MALAALSSRSNYSPVTSPGTSPSTWSRTLPPAVERAEEAPKASLRQSVWRCRPGAILGQRCISTRKRNARALTTAISRRSRAGNVVRHTRQSRRMLKQERQAIPQYDMSLGLEVSAMTPSATSFPMTPRLPALTLIYRIHVSGQSAAAHIPTRINAFRIESQTSARRNQPQAVMRATASSPIILERAEWF